MTNLDLIFIPYPAAGHLLSALELATCLLDRNARLSVTVLCIEPHYLPALASHTKSLVSSYPRIKLIDLPCVDPPPASLRVSATKFVPAYIENHVPQVCEVLSNGAWSPSAAAVVLDFVCEPMIDAAKEFGLRTYIYVPTNAAFLGLMLDLPDSHGGNQSAFDVSLGFSLSVPGFTNPVPVSVLPGGLLDGEHGGFAAYMKLFRGLKKVDGILVNTFAELEPYDYGSAFACCVYKVGPLLNLKSMPDPNPGSSLWDYIWKWLDDQPPASVVFLCFGSKGKFRAKQAREIAFALESSGKSFLWSLRLSSETDNLAEPEKFLPEGFLERTTGKGVVCGWAPQVEVLAHRAMGGFVSHCGWNSILESLWHGVPIATWPMYAEQQLNTFWLVKEKGLAVELRLDYRDGAPIVEAGEIERAITQLMDGGGEIREKVKLMKDLARKARTEAGSTAFPDIGRFIDDILA